MKWAKQSFLAWSGPHQKRKVEWNDQMICVTIDARRGQIQKSWRCEFLKKWLPFPCLLRESEFDLHWPVKHSYILAQLGPPPKQRTQQKKLTKHKLACPFSFFLPEALPLQICSTWRYVSPAISDCNNSFLPTDKICNLAWSTLLPGRELCQTCDAW